MGKQYPCEKCKAWPLKVPIYQCPTGHVFCDPCYVKICPNCKKTDSNEQRTRSLALEFMQPVKCKNEKCPELFDFPKQMESHATKKCMHRKIQVCRMLGIPDCPFEASPSTIQVTANHLAKEHQAYCLSDKNDGMAFDVTYRFNVRNRNFDNIILSYILDSELLTVVKLFKEDGLTKIHALSLGEESLPGTKNVLEIKFEKIATASSSGVTVAGVTSTTTDDFHYDVKMENHLQEYKVDVAPVSKRMQSLHFTHCTREWFQNNAEDFEPVPKKAKIQPTT